MKLGLYRSAVSLRCNGSVESDEDGDDTPRQVNDKRDDHEFKMPRRLLVCCRIAVSVFTFGMSLMVVYVFLFIGFNAFTDPNDTISGLINSSVAFGVSLGAHYAYAKDGDEEDVKDAVDQMQEQVMRTLKKVFQMVTNQLDLAMKLFKRMQNNIDDAAEGESSRASDDSSSSSDGK